MSWIQMFCWKTGDIQKAIFLDDPLYGDIEDQIWMSSWRCSNKDQNNAIENLLIQTWEMICLEKTEQEISLL